MPEATISVNGTDIGTVDINPLLFDAAGGPEFPYLTVTAKVSLRPAEVRGSTPINQPTETFRNYTVIQTSGRVLFQIDGRGLIPMAKFVTNPMTLFTYGSTQSFNIELELDPYRVRSIERQRHGDQALQLEINWLILKHPDGGRGEWNREVKEIETAYTNIQQITIPQSHWITLLPKLGYGKVQLVEIPIPSEVIPGAFTEALKELDEAQKDVIQGNYDNAVGHCRNAIERIADLLPCPPNANGRHPTFRDKTKNLLAAITPLLTPDKQKGLDEIMNALWQWSSNAQHPRIPSLFNRYDAETIMMFTTAILSYIGRLLVAASNPI